VTLSEESSLSRHNDFEPATCQSLGMLKGSVLPDKIVNEPFHVGDIAVGSVGPVAVEKLRS
jgi:hypothetical protein